MPGSVSLRPEQLDDLPLLTGGESPFDDFGPRAIRTHVRAPKLDESGALTILDEDGALAGDITWHWTHWGPNHASRCPMIGIWLRPGARGRGIGRAAQRQLAELFFAHTDTNRVEAHTDVENIPEQRSLKAAGFQQEGLIRGAHYRHGAHRDGYLYSILRGDLAPAQTPEHGHA